MVQTSIIEKFWKPALAIGGVSSVGAFIFYSLNKQWLTLPIFSKLTPNQTFIIMLVFLSFIFLVTTFMLIAWFYDKKNSVLTPTSPSITFTIPEPCTFEQAANALTSEDNSVIEFIGFNSEILKIQLRPRTLKANTTLRALELLKPLGQSDIPNYRVEKQDGKYSISLI